MAARGFQSRGLQQLRRLSLCRVRGDLTYPYGRMPALPAGLQELTLDSGPAGEPPADGGEGLRDRPTEGLDLRHLPALTRLTLVSLTSALLSESLLGYPYGTGADPPRFPPRLRVLSLREPACASGKAISVYLSWVLHAMRAAPPLAGLPVLHVRADTVKCWPSELWHPLSDTGLPGSFRIQTQRLCLSMLAALRCAGHAVRGQMMCGLTPDETLLVRPAEALCQLLRSMPLCVKEFGLGCVAQQPLCLQLEWYVHRAARAAQPCQPCHVEASFATAGDPGRQPAAARERVRPQGSNDCGRGSRLCGRVSGRKQSQC